MTDRVGEQFGNYHLIRRLGAGNFAEVYLAEHRYIETQTAIKVLASLDAEDMERFQEEAGKIARLEHPRIVRMLDFGIEREVPYLVMAYAPNGTLRQRFPRGKQEPLEMLLPYIRQVGEALQYIHDLKLIHQDVKPENLLLDAKNAVLLSDFGLATLAESTHSQRTGSPAGTAAYMAKEQWDGKPKPASDQYALGIMVYEWLVGERPFHGSATALMAQHFLSKPPPLHKKVPAILPDVERVVLTALQKEPYERFDSVQAFVSALEQASQQRPVTFAPSNAPAPEKTPEITDVDLLETQVFADVTLQKVTPVEATLTEKEEEKPPDPPVTQRPLSKRAIFRKEKLKSEAFSVGSWTFFLLGGLGAIVGVNTQSWPWAVGTVVLAVVLASVFGHRKALSSITLVIMALVSAALVYKLTVFLAGYDYGQVQTSHLLFDAVRHLTLRSQIIAGACAGAIGSLWGFYVYSDKDHLDLSMLFATLFLALPTGAILWLGLSTLGSIFDWGFGFGYGWDFSLLDGFIITALGGLGLIASTFLWREAHRS